MRWLVVCCHLCNGVGCRSGGIGLGAAVVDVGGRCGWQGCGSFNGGLGGRARGNGGWVGFVLHLGSRLVGAGGRLHTEVGSGGSCLGVDVDSGGGISLGLGILQ